MHNVITKKYHISVVTLISRRICDEVLLFTSRDGRLLAAGGRSRFIHLWDLDTHRLLRIIELPVKVTAVKQLVFLPDNFDAGASQVCLVTRSMVNSRFISMFVKKPLLSRTLAN
jgi:WD40 repeat protein